MKKWTHVCPLLGVALIACATGETESPNQLGVGTAGNDGTAGTAEPTAGTGTGGSATGTAGTSEGGSATAGTGTAGAFTFSGTSSFAGSFGTAGTASGGAAGTASGGTGGASAGAGGKASGGNGGSGGKAGGGAGGMAGAGGGGNAMCAGTTLPAKATWTATASASDPAYLPPKVLDGDNGTRWSTGSKMVGGEWLQIDFGAVVTLNEVTLHTNNGDFFRHYELRLSNTSQDFAAAILKEADGVTGTIVVPLAQAKAGRYLTIRQTGMLEAGETAWWSLHEVNVACK